MWERVKLGDVLLRTEYGTSAKASRAGTREIIGMRQISNGRVKLDGLSRVEEAPSLLRLRVRPGDILLNRTNSPDQVGKVGIVRHPTDAVFASYLVRLVPNPNCVEPEYLNAVLNESGVQQGIRALATRGVSQSNVNPTTLKRNLAISLPPLAEQRKIAEILRTWDDAIDAAERTREFMIRRRKAVVDRLVFPSGKPLGLKLGGVPEGWKAQLIGTLAREVSERNTSRETDVILSCSKHLGFVLNEDYFGRSTHSADVSRYKLIRFGQFGFPSNHVEEGSIGLQNLVELAAVSPIYTVFEFGPQVDHGFAFLVFKTEAYRHMFEVSTSASVSRRGSLRWNEFSRLSFPVPSIARQGEIVRAVAAVDTELALLDRKIELLKRQKRGLMQKLLSGEIRVNTDDVHNDEGVGA